MYDDDHDSRSNLTKVVTMALIPATFVISLISFSSYNTEAQTFTDNNNTNSTFLTELFTKVNQSVVTDDVAANTTDPSNSTSG
jgi:hypothetical protein